MRVCSQDPVSISLYLSVHCSIVHHFLILTRRTLTKSQRPKPKIPTFPSLIFATFNLNTKRKKKSTMVRTRKGSLIVFNFFTILLLNSPSGHAITNPIKTVVVLVMENRSFDHMLGWMKKLNPAINGVTGLEYNPISVSDPKAKRFFFKNGAQYVDPDPGHSFQAIREQIFGSNDTSPDPAPMNGFAQQAYSMDNTTKMSQNVMNGFDPDMVSVYKTLVSEFAVFDR